MQKNRHLRLPSFYVNTAIAKKVGLEGAILFEIIEFNCLTPSYGDREKYKLKGIQWMQCSTAGFADAYPWWSIYKVGRMTHKLEDAGYIRSKKNDLLGTNAKMYTVFNENGERLAC